MCNKIDERDSSLPLVVVAAGLVEGSCSTGSSRSSSVDPTTNVTRMDAGKERSDALQW